MFACTFVSQKEICKFVSQKENIWGHQSRYSWLFFPWEKEATVYTLSHLWTLNAIILLSFYELIFLSYLNRKLFFNQCLGVARIAWDAFGCGGNHCTHLHIMYQYWPCLCLYRCKCSLYCNWMLTIAIFTLNCRVGFSTFSLKRTTNMMKSVVTTQIWTVRCKQEN